ncbi:hypothetical protein [Jeotgalibaca caeni]|uniref:hypothetical protein n=1 Tax=Jeotgalibaca caeni TaxID=3028623 RepID=UPI00237D6BAC|nr:hypothetical protein [Jeotgalibaca caeni]MDE1549268.1 hypothetical protein [Jeotgalibaca caeni]
MITNLLDDYIDAFQYLKSYYKAEPMNVYFYMFVSSLFVLAAGLDSVEAAFSKDVLFMSDGQYGMLVSISGVGFLVGSILNTLIVESLTIRQLILLGGSMYMIGYLIVSTSFNFFSASIGFFLISFALAYINTGFRTYIPFAFPINKIGQLTTAFNIMISLLEMMIVALVSIAGSIIQLRFVLIGIELIMVLIFFFIIHYSKKLKIDLMSERKEEIEIFDGVKLD